MCDLEDGVVIYTMMPYDDSGSMNLGKAYNDHMALLPEDAWAVLMDHDMVWTTRVWNPQIAEAIAFRPDAGAFTAVTNRIAAPWQQVGEKNNHAYDHHRRFGTERLQVRTLLDITNTKGFGGVVICLSKKVWREVGGFVDGMACVDHHMHFALGRAGRKVYLIEGLYVYHWRRAFGDDIPANAPVAANCPCRGKEIWPSLRLTLPEAA